MVICQYFLTGCCHFGKKCLNEHVDLKNIIKTEIENALNGNQWPLSCFGALKEKPCLPNFVVDQSFEEIRLQFYNDGKIQGNIQQIQMNFYNLIQEAKTKMQSFTSLSNDSILAIIRMYNNVPDPSNAYKTNTATIYTTPQDFGQGGQTIQGGNIFGNQNMFGNPQTQTVQPMNSFALPQIGQQNQNIAAAAPNIFAQQSGFNTNPNMSIQNQQSTNIFASMNNQINSTLGNQMQPQQQPPPPSFGATVNNQGFGINSNVQQPHQQIQTNVFGQQTQQQAQSPFANVPFNQSTFQQNQIQPNSNAIFQQSQTQPHYNTTLHQNITQPHSNLVYINNQTNKMSQASMHSTNIFGNPPVQQQVFMPQNNNSNQLQQIQPNVFGGNLHNPQLPETIYSKITELTQEELEQFNSENFTLGKVPKKAPPKELC